MTDAAATPELPDVRPRVVLLTLGGTISMTSSDGGVVPRLRGDDLVAGLPGLGGDVDLEVRDLHAVPSPDLSFIDIVGAVEAAEEALEAGARGVVLTQGTDTLEETAFLVDLLWRHDAPFVLTGAMRNPTLPGADGPANVLAAVRVAASESARGRGALVAFLDEVHAARHVRKTHSLSPATFQSPDVGPVGHVVEGVVRFLAHTTRARAIGGITRQALAETRIGLHTATLDDDGALLAHVPEAYAGLVVAGFGVGHVPASLAPVLGELAGRMPVVLATRTGAGPVLARTYGAVGSERDLRERGLIGAGFLHPLKARVLLRLLVAAGAPTAEIAAAFDEIGGC